MLTLEQIKKYYSEEVLKKNLKAVFVEYLQYEILDSIFKQKGSEKLSFMGGTAIRIIYGGNRFSEDLDFDNFGLNFSDFKKMLEKVVYDMKVKGFEIEFRFVKKGAYHCYIKFPKLLFENNLTNYKSEKILVRIDTVKKKKIAKPAVVLIDKFNVYRNILVNSKEVILVQKIIAILERERAKGRDFYDVSFLLGMVDVDYIFLEKSIGINKKELKNKLLKRVESINLEELVKDVMPFLMNLDEKIRITDFKKYIENKI